MLKNPIWLFGITLVILVLFLPSYTKMSDLRRKNADYDAEMIRLKKQTAVLEREKKLLEDDPEYLEKVGREKMGLVKEGEVIYRLKPASEVKQEQVQNAVTVPEKK